MKNLIKHLAIGARFVCLTTALLFAAPAHSTQTALPPDMFINMAGVQLIKESEGLFLHAHHDGDGSLLIGYGHKGNVHKNTAISESQADKILARDIAVRAQWIKAHAPQPLTENQLAALTSFYYNMRNFKQTTVYRAFQAGQYNQVTKEMARYVYADGQFQKGLRDRRKREMALWATPNKTPDSSVHEASLTQPIASGVILASYEKPSGSLPQVIEHLQMAWKRFFDTNQRTASSEVAMPITTIVD